MGNINLLWLLLVPFFLSVVSFVILPRLTNNDVEYKHSALFSLIGFFIGAVIISMAFFIARGSKMHDTEVWNGRITEKTRKHDTYMESYSCNCKSVRSCSGSGKNRTCSSSQVCDTCWRRHFTVKWDAHSTIGSFRIKSLDETDDYVYRSPDPQQYIDTQVGEPCARTNSYTNYIKAVPESLFRPNSGELKKTFGKMLPEYPLNIYSDWKLNRVIPVGVTVPNLKEWNQGLSEILKDLGAAKQVNAVIVIANTPDETYSYALQDHWVGGKKNDVIVVIGAPKFPERASWVRVIALTDNELFKIRLQSEIMKLESLTADEVLTAIQRNVLLLYKRKPMKDFEYLEAEIDPPMWVNVTTVCFVILAYIGFWIFASRGMGNTYRRRTGRKFSF